MAAQRGPQVYLVGLGMPELRTLTREAFEVLSQCRTLFVNNAGLPLFTDICPDVRAVGELTLWRNPESIRGFISKVVAAARRRPPVAYASYGHPLLYETSAIHLLRGCRQAGLRCRVISGISTIDALLSQLCLPMPVEAGLHVTSPAHLARATPDTTSHVIVFRICESLERSRFLRRRLLKFYPPSHRVALVKCPNWEPGRVRWLPIRDLPPKGQKADTYMSLLIPPLPPPS